jgi:hypothetical protein
MNDKRSTIVDLLKPGSEVTDSSIQATDSRDKTVDETEYEAFSHGRIGRRPQMMIVFRKCSGEVVAYPYSMLSRIRSEDVDRGFTLSFAGTDIIIEGRQLARLFNYVCEHRAAEIIELDRAEAMAESAECVVTRVTVSKPGG